MDLPNIEIVVQWKASNLDLNTLVQRFGRGGRNLRKQALCLLLVEPDFTDKERRNKAAKAEKAVEKRLAKESKSQVECTTKTVGKRCRPTSPDNRRVRPRNAADNDTSDNVMDIDVNLDTETSQLPGVQPEKVVAHRKAPMTKAERIQLNLNQDIDAFINAGEPGREKCRREPTARIYGNDKLCERRVDHESLTCLHNLLHY